MKKFIFLIVTIYMLIVFTACENDNKMENFSAGDGSNNGNMDFSIEYTSLNECNNFSFEEPQRGFITNTEHKDSIYLLKDFEAYGDGIYHNAYLLIETPSKLMKITYRDAGCYASNLYLCDVDGDLLDEIVLQQTMGMSGGAGQYLSRIFKINENHIEELFASDSFDTGYYSMFRDGFQLNIINRWTSDLYDLKCIGKYIDIYFDDSGNVINDTASIRCDSFNSFTPIDVDGDGVFELYGSQYISLNGHSDYIGDAQSILKFNPKTKHFEVVESDFSAAETHTFE